MPSCRRPRSCVAQLRLEIAAALGQEVEHIPHWIEQVVVAVLLAGVGRHIEKLAPPEMADGLAVALEHVEHRHVPLLARLELLLFAHAEGERGRVAEIVAIVVVASRGKEPQVAPATLVCEGENARQRRLRDDGEIEALARVPCRAVKAIEKMSAAGAWPFALRPEHETIDRESVLAGREQSRQLHLDRLALRGGFLENVVFSHFPAGR